MVTSWHLAQVNVARAKAPLDSPELREFMALLAEINALADAAPGFVWRLAGQAADEPASVAAADPRLLVNMSVWTSAELLFQYVYKSAHTGVMVRRREWFERPSEAHQALWWVPAGHIPHVDEAWQRLELLRRLGPSAEAFTFKQRFPPPGVAGAPEDMGAEPYCSGWY